MSAVFRQWFGGEPAVMVRAPGRVNLIGEHTDYNDGLVLPAAINLELRLELRPRDDDQRVLRSRELGDGAGGWGVYVEGVAQALGAGGFDVAVASDIPVGSGLSSSAALELATARALAPDWDSAIMARLCQQVENDVVGNRCGIMDQLAVALGRAGQALFIDCRSLAVEPVPMPQGVSIVICDSATPRQLVTSAYNDRREACEEAARQLGQPALRDASASMLERLPELLARRARHVIEENERVAEMVAALRAGDLHRSGMLMLASHASLRDLFEVSSPELDLLVELARASPGCFGSRLTGAGFGGCTVSLVDSEHARAIAAAVIEAYRQRTSLPGRAYICQAVDGVSFAAPSPS